MASDILTLIREGATIVVGMGFVFWLNWKLATVAVSIVSSYLLWMRHWNPKVRTFTREMQDNYSSAAGDMIEALSGIYLVKAFVAEQAELMKMLRSFKSALHSEFQVAMTANILTIGASLISSLGKVSLVWFGCWEIMKGHLTLGAFLAFNSFLQYLFEPSQKLLNLNTNVQQSLIALDRIFEILDEKTETGQERQTKKLEYVRGRVEFRNICFSHNGNGALLSDMNLSLVTGPAFFTRLLYVGRMTIMTLGWLSAGKGDESLGLLSA